mmetsp:Transcript_15183/g.28285  ORF Transcript_15183/g.28285 Transcript_15183/m.28285 type:complete len:2956 (+) Transcript_15183:251-9118(+)
MAKRIILEALQSTLGKYCSNLDVSTLKVRLFDGKITLKDLILNIDAVNEMLKALPSPPPFQVTGGSLGEVLVEIPWTKLSSKSVKVQISSLTILVETTSSSPSDAPEYSASERQNPLIRQTNVTAKNHTRLKTRQLTHSDLWDGDNEEQEEASDSFGSRLVQRIIENLSISISDVNVEIINDSHKHKSRTGFSLKSFNLHSTDSEGNPTFIDRSTATSSFLYKSLSISGLSLHCTSLASSETDYIIKPLQLQLNVKHNDSNDCTIDPKYAFETSLPSLTVQLSKQQLMLVTAIFRVVEVTNFSPLFPEHRPNVSVKDDPRMWWRYALVSIGRISRRRSWREFIKAWGRRSRYVKLYKRARYTESEGGTKYRVLPEDYDFESCIENRLPALTSEELHDLYLIEEDFAITPATLMAWRDLAEVEYKMECGKVKKKEKKTHKSFQNFLFGSKKKAGDDEDEDEGLTPEELQSIQSSLISPPKALLKPGSILLSLKFALNAFKFELFNPSPILRTMIIGLNAHATVNSDNSRNFLSNINSISVMDECTINNQFPSVVKQLSKSTEEAISFRVDQTQTEDSDVKLCLTGFQITPSISFLNALKDFANLSAPDPRSNLPGNPTLEQSVATGNYDLFYDASDPPAGTLDHHPLDDPSVPQFNFDLDITDNLGSAWSEAWNNKVKCQATWTLDLDLHAPVFVLPIDHTDADSKFLEINLGHFCFKTVKESDKQVQDFFSSEKITAWDDFQLELDGLKVQSRQGENDPNLIVNPTALHVSVGLERTSSTPLMCLDCVLPLFSVQLNSASAAVLRSLADDWQEGMGAGGVEDEEDDASVNSYSSNNSVSSRMSTSKRRRREQIDNISKDVKKSKRSSKASLKPLLMASFTLQQLTMCLTTLENTSISANLVSVKSSLRSYENKNMFELKMGYFWIIDGLLGDRRQELFLHSDLPLSSLAYSANGYKINESLTELGVYENTFSSTSLCYVTVNQSEASVDVNFKMESIEAHYNPMAVRNILDFVGKMKERHQEQLQIIPPSPTKRQTSFTRSASRVGLSRPSQNEKETPPPPVNLSFEFKSFVLNMNSANDDLPIFTLKLSTMKVGVLLTAPESITMAASLDDISITTPSNDRVNEDYNCIFGLASGVSSSLLEIKYFKNSAVEAKKLDCFADVENVETFCHVSISKIRFVHIQAQILILTDYIQNGILGVVGGAKEGSGDGIISEESGASFFKIEGSEFEIVVPLGASSLTRSVFNTRKLDIEYNAYENAAGGKMGCELDGFMMRIENCPVNGDVLEDEVTFNVVVDLPGEAFEEEDEVMKEINVQINISSINLAVKKSQFDDIMYMVENNITNPDPCLRSNNANVLDSMMVENKNNTTHAGIEFEEEEKVIKVMIGMENLNLKLSLADKSDFVTLGAKHININNVLQGNEIEMKMKMKSLVVESYGRSFFAREDIFDDILDLEYKKIGGGGGVDRGDDVKVKIKVDKPAITVLPDVLADLGSFFEKDERVGGERVGTEGEGSVAHSTYKFDVNMTDGLVKLINSETDEYFGLRTSASIKSDGSTDSRETKSSNEVQINDLEIFKAKTSGNDTTTAVLQRVNLIVHLSSVVSNTGAGTGTGGALARLTLKVLCATPLECDISLRTLKLVFLSTAYLSGGADANQTPGAGNGLVDLQGLDMLETALKIEGDDEDDMSSVASDNYSIDQRTVTETELDAKGGGGTGGRSINFNITIPSVTILLIDDLKILKPIVRVSLDDCTLGLEGCEGALLTMYGRSQGHTDLRVDWWGGGEWKELIHTWNITIQASRTHNESKAGLTGIVGSGAGGENVAKMLTSFHLMSSTLKVDLTSGFLSRLLEVQERWNYILKHNPSIFVTCHNSLLESSMKVKTINNDKLDKEVKAGERLDIEYSNDKGSYDTDHGVKIELGDDEFGVNDVSWTAQGNGVYGRVVNGLVVVRSGLVVRNQSLQKIKVEIESAGVNPDLGVLDTGDFRSSPIDVVSAYAGKGSAGLAILLSVDRADGELKGVIAVPSAAAIEQLDEVFDIPITCKGVSGGDKVCFKARVSVERLEGGEYLVDVVIKPRSKIVNLLPLEVEVKTVMPNTLSALGVEKSDDGADLHLLKSGESVEVFNEGRSIACAFKVASETLAGSPTDWVAGTWIEMQFSSNQSRNSAVGLAGEMGKENSRFLFPFYEGAGGSPFQILSSTEETDVFEIKQLNVIRDHSGEVTFINEGDDVPMSMYANESDGGARTCLIGEAGERMRMTRYEDGKPVLSNSFCLNDIAITSSGGLTASSLVIEGTSDVEPYAIYRSMNGEGHVIPYFRIVNETGVKISVVEPGEKQGKLSIADRATSVLKPSRRGVFVTIEVEGLGIAGPFTVDRRVGTCVSKVMDREGNVVGGVRVHTFDGGKFARLLGRVTLIRDGGGRGGGHGGKDDIMDVDVITAKVSMEGMIVTLREGLRRRGKGRGESLGEEGDDDGAMDLFGLPAPPPRTQKKKSSVGLVSGQDFDVPIVNVILTGLDVDMRVVFKDGKRKSRLVTTINGIVILGETGEFPTKIYCGDIKSPFLQAAFQWNGFLDDPVVAMDSVVISVGGGGSQKLSIATHENFLWKMLDVATSIQKEARAKIEGGDVDDPYADAKIVDYTSSASEQIFNFKSVKLRPIKLVVTFKRTPEKDRWENEAAAVDSPMMAYFMTSLKFTVDNATLSFAGYETSKVKGSVDTLVTLISAVYLNRIKYKWTSLVSAVSFQEWKLIAGREGGGDGREEGDILRAVGNIAGTGSGVIFSELAGGLGGGFSKGVSKVGDGFQKGTEALGIGEVGKGVNSVVSGLGDGVGSTVRGLGDGVGSTAKGLGKGAGQIVGGVAGGLHKVGKGFAKGIGKGDGDAILKGLGDGAVAIGSGVGGGLETALVGVGDGLMSVGGGLWGGVKNIGRGIQHSVDGKGGTKDKERRKARDDAKQKPKRTSFFG